MEETREGSPGFAHVAEAARVTADDAPRLVGEAIGAAILLAIDLVEQLIADAIFAVLSFVFSGLGAA